MFLASSDYGLIRFLFCIQLRAYSLKNRAKFSLFVGKEFESDVTFVLCVSFTLSIAQVRLVKDYQSKGQYIPDF